MQLTEAEAYESVIWSADVPDIAAIAERLDAMPKLRVIKIDRLFVDNNGWEIFDFLRERGILVFDDAKIVEIPSKGENLAETHCRKARPWMLNCMASIESSDVLEDPEPEKIDGLKRFADICHANGVKPCAVTVLTSTQPDVVKRQYNGRSVVEQVLYYTGVVHRCGFREVVCSAKEAAAVHSEYPDVGINSAGIRPAGSAAGDQARTDTPAGALRAGVKRAVVGRPITNDHLLDAIVAEMVAA